MLAADDLAHGRLVALSDIAIPLGHAYSLVHPISKSRNIALKQLIDWLVNQVH